MEGVSHGPNQGVETRLIEIFRATCQQVLVLTTYRRYMMQKLIWIIALLLMGNISIVSADSASEYQGDTFAIAAESKDISAKISHLSGPAPFFHIYAINGNQIRILPNPHLNLEIGIGPAAAATLGDMGVTVLVGGMAGPKMRDVLDAKGVRFVPRVGKVKDVVKELQEQ